MLDIFVLHEQVLDAHRCRREARCISVKEDSNASHANQSYKQLMAINDNKVAVKTLSSQRKIIRTQNHGQKLDQWSLIHTVIALVVVTTEETWQSSFVVVNLHPLGQKDFDAFCGTRIKMFLELGQTMASERATTSTAEKYAFLPPFWNIMTSGENQIGLNIIAMWKYEYTAKCVEELHTTCKVLLSNVNDLCVCLLMAREHPEMV